MGPGAAGISQQVFCEVLARRLVVIEDRFFWKINLLEDQVQKCAGAQCRCSCRAQEKPRPDCLQRSSPYGPSARRSTDVCCCPSPTGARGGRLGVNSAPVNSDVIADLHWAAIDEKNVLGTDCPMHLTESFEERFESRIQRVEPAIEAASAEAASAEAASKIGGAFEQVLGSQRSSLQRSGQLQPKAVIISASLTFRWELS